MVSVFDVLEEWLGKNDDRRVVVSHGGAGGSWYVLMEDEGGELTWDGTGETLEGAVGAALESAGLIR